MANIPGMTNVLPGVWGYTHYTVYKKSDDNYFIEYYSVVFSGSCKDIAKQIISKLSNNSNYQPFTLKRNLNIFCKFQENVNPPEGETLEELENKINDELKRYSSLLAFI